jgi:hypothetical protein
MDDRRRIAERDNWPARGTQLTPIPEPNRQPGQFRPPITQVAKQPVRQGRDARLPADHERSIVLRILLGSSPVNRRTIDPAIRLGSG